MIVTAIMPKSSNWRFRKKQAEAERSHIISIAVAVIAVLAIVFALYFFRQKRVISEKNYALVRMINGMQPKPVDTSAGNNVDSALFDHIDTAIRSEHLYANVGLQRQDICDHYDYMLELFRYIEKHWPRLTDDISMAIPILSLIRKGLTRFVKSWNPTTSDHSW